MLRFGQVAVGSRSELDRLEHERDEWKARAEALAAQLAMERSERIAERKGDPPRRSPRQMAWTSVLAAFWIFIAGLFVGVVVPKAQGPTLVSDLPQCISTARYEHPIKGNQYQELVNALYACKVYGGTS